MNVGTGVDTGIVQTPLGDIPDFDLDLVLVPMKLEDGRIVTARECRYTGRNPALADHVGKVVRCDVWDDTGEREGDPVFTTEGNLPATDLDIKIIPQVGGPNVWVVARECRYKGSDSALSAKLGEIIRRDVWATIKSGHSMSGEQAKLG
jgi:hypothetical protein